MRVVKPTKIAVNSAMLISSTAVESVALWSAATSYTVGTQVYLTATQRVYENLIAGVDGVSPDVAVLVVVTPRWFDVGPTNRWAMFDDVISTPTTAPNTLTVVVKPGYVNALSLFGLVGTSLTVTMRDGLAGPVVYSLTVPLDGTLIADWYQYYWEPSVQLSEVVLSDLAPYLDGHVTLTITGPSTVKIGAAPLGVSYDLGDTQYGATAGITDYSTKTIDRYGNALLKQGEFSKRANFKLMLPKSQVTKTFALLTALRSTPCVWSGTTVAGYEPLIIFGYFRDFQLEVPYPTYSMYSLEIEGLI